MLEFNGHSRVRDLLSLVQSCPVLIRYLHVPLSNRHCPSHWSVDLVRFASARGCSRESSFRLGNSGSADLKRCDHIAARPISINGIYYMRQYYTLAQEPPKQLFVYAELFQTLCTRPRRNNSQDIDRYRLKSISIEGNRFGMRYQRKRQLSGVLQKQICVRHISCNGAASAYRELRKSAC
jgi:hypothetical protein